MFLKARFKLKLQQKNNFSELTLILAITVER